MNNYKTSKDYSHLKALLDAGQEVIIIHPIYGVGKAYKYESSDHKIVKYDFASFTIFSSRLPRLKEILTEQNIEYIEPTSPAVIPAGRPAYTNLVVELKEYLATTPPEQQQRDWEQIKAELPDAGQVPVIFYGLSGSTSHTSTTVTPIDPDEDPVKAQAQMKFQEVSYIHSKLVGSQALLDFEQFLSLARYFSTYSLNMVLAETERRIFEIKSGWLEKKFNDSYGGGALDYLTHILVYIKSLLSAPKLTHSVTKKTDQVIKNDNLENELQSLLKESGVTTDYVHQDFLRVVASHFAAYGKDQFLKAMKENHVDTI